MAFVPFHTATRAKKQEVEAAKSTPEAGFAPGLKPTPARPLMRKPSPKSTAEAQPSASAPGPEPGHTGPESSPNDESENIHERSAEPPIDDDLHNDDPGRVDALETFLLPNGMDLRTALEHAYEEGRQAGTNETEARLQTQVDALRERAEREFQVLGKVVAELSSARLSAVASADATIAELVLVLARRIAGETLVLNPESLVEIVTKSLERLPEGDEVWVRVPPESVEWITAALGPRHHAQITGDPNIDAGCVVETRQAEIDSTLEAAMAGVTAAIQTWLESRQ